MDGDFKQMKNQTTDYSLDPRDHEWVNNDTMFQWRKYLLEELLKQRQYKSDLSGNFLYRVEMHEGILTRARVPKNVKWHYMLFHPFNCFLLTPEEHRPKPPSRQWAIQRAYELYGRDAVVEWFYSLPFKAFPFKLT